MLLVGNIDYMYMYMYLTRIFFDLFILYSSCLYLQAHIYREDFLNERSDRTNAHKEYTQDILQYKATIKQLKDELSKNATTITQLEEVKKSLQENKDIKKYWDEEGVGFDQQLRAYKRQIDDLRRQLSERRQKSLEERARMKEKSVEFDAKVSFNS